VAPIVGGLLVLLLLAGGLLARDLLTVRSSLLAAQASLSEVRDAAGAIDVERASAALAQADRELATARSRSGGPLWTLAASLPVAGDSISVTRGVVRVASAALDVAQQAVARGDELLGTGLDVRVADGRVDLAPLEQARQVLDGLPVERLAAARNDLRALEPGWAPASLLEGRRDTLRLADEAVGSIERGQQLLGALPSFLGAEGERRYFLGVQTPAELRGTGGLIGFWAVLTVDDGRISLTSSEVYDANEDVDGAPDTGDIQTLRGDEGDAVPTSPEFQERYGTAASAWLFADVNLDPDLPTVAPVALDLFAHRTGETLDGMILLDPVGMQTILRGAGDDALPLPDDAVAAGAPASIAVEDFVRFATIDLYEVLGVDHSRERKLALRQLGDLAFARVFDGAWDGVSMSRAVGEAAGGRHLQVFSRDEQVQQAFEQVGAAGQLAVPDGSDLLALTANNVVGGKQDVHVGHEVRADITLDAPLVDADGRITVERRTRVGVELDNPLPTDGMDLYVIGNCLLPPERGCFAGEPGINRTWFSVWTPGTAVQEAVSEEAPVLRTEVFRGLRVFDRYVETPSEDRGGFELAYRGEAPVVADGDDLVYELAWWQQAKAIPTLLDLTIEPPEGWRVVGVEVGGGGDGRGLGVHGEGRPVTAEVDGEGRATLMGTVSADARLRVVLRRLEDA
jgi:hypothetical protein